MARFQLELPTGTAADVADYLEEIADMVRDGFTSGFPSSGGHWSVEALYERGECQSCAEATETRLLPCDECGAIDGEEEGDPHAAELIDE